jgi:osmotically-inducible protein OsmY
MDTQRSEAELKAPVLDEFACTPDLNDDNVGIRTASGAVTLSGTVATHPESVLSEAAAEKAREASEALGNTVGLPGNLVKVTVADGWVTLTGLVETHYERYIADRAVRHLVGIMGVHNEVTVRRPASVAGLKSAISDALARNAELEAARSTVTVEARCCDPRRHRAVLDRTAAGMCDGVVRTRRDRRGEPPARRELSAPNQAFECTSTLVTASMRRDHRSQTSGIGTLGLSGQAQTRCPRHPVLRRRPLCPIV